MISQAKLKALAIVAATLWCASVSALSISGQGTWETTLQPRDLNGDGAPDAFYDTALNLTWLADLNYANTSGYLPPLEEGLMRWDGAMTWATTLNYFGISGWRLPKTRDIGTPGCVVAFSGSDCGYNVNTSVYADGDNSEFAHLYHVTLGNISLADPVTGKLGQPGGGLTNTGPFANFQGGGYWSNTEDVTDSTSAWYFDSMFGIQEPMAKGFAVNAVAVHDGDIALLAPVPEPANFLLVSSGLCFSVIARRRLKMARRDSL